MTETTSNTDTAKREGVSPLVRQPVVLKAIGIGKSTLWRWIREGRFPKPVRLGANCVAWRADDVNQWINSRPAFDVEEA